jgi:hypothetical protein
VNPKSIKIESPNLLINPILMSDDELNSKLSAINCEIAALLKKNGVADKIQRLRYAQAQLIATKAIVQIMINSRKMEAN